MPEDQIQKIYATILDVQKQVSDINRQTGEQTEKLISIEAQTIKTNGRVTKLEGITSSMEIVTATDSGKKSVRTAIQAAIIGVILTVLAAIIANKLGVYIK